MTARYPISQRSAKFGNIQGKRWNCPTTEQRAVKKLNNSHHEMV